MLPRPIVDEILTLQLLVAWAGEAETEPPRLGWWKSALTDPFGGGDLLRRVAPRSAEWAVFQLVREAARRTDSEARTRLHEPDRYVTLFHLGFEVDEQVGERLTDLRRAGGSPRDRLVGLQQLDDMRSRAGCVTWLTSFAAEPWDAAPLGRRLRGTPPADPTLTARKLLGALQPLSDVWPVPYFDRGGAA